MKLRTCVTPACRFVYGVHKPEYKIKNLREGDSIQLIGTLANGESYDNRKNFPAADVQEEGADWIYEIPNPFPFRGSTYIRKYWADQKANDHGSIKLSSSSDSSVIESIKKSLESSSASDAEKVFFNLPGHTMVAIAANSSDPQDLEKLAGLCCELEYESSGRPAGMKFTEDKEGRVKPLITNHDLFEALVNNVHLPDDFKEVMVLRPGVQGESEIVGEWPASEGGGHIYEYLRRNSYIPWGHFASNMADDSVRYRFKDLSAVDFKGLRHLYYQRTYVRMAHQLGVPLMSRWKHLKSAEIEELRKKVFASLVATEAGFSKKPTDISFNGTIWGWNYGFDVSPRGYKLHASHQQIHQQYAMLPSAVEAVYSDDSEGPGHFKSFSCGEMIEDFIKQYNKVHNSNFFYDYALAIKNNSRMDGNEDADKSLIVYEDKRVMLYVPKAQTSQWELQLMTLDPVGNILETDTVTRDSIDRAMIIVMHILTAMGARMVTSIEYSKRFNEQDIDQRLLYSFLPKLPYSPGGFTEAQLRWICGHYPEDFAAACRGHLLDAMRRVDGI